MDKWEKRIIKYEVEDYSVYSKECCKNSIPEQLAESIFLKAAEKINKAEFTHLGCY